MNFRLAIKRHEDMATEFARIGKAKLASRELRKANELRTARKIRQELRNVAA